MVLVGSVWYSTSEDSTADWQAAREINLHSQPKRIVRLFRRDLSHFLSIDNVYTNAGQPGRTCINCSGILLNIIKIYSVF